MKANINSDSFQ